DYTGVGRLSPGGNALTYSALFGGTGDVVTGVALDATGAATVVGYTFNSRFPTTTGAYDQSWNGGNDAFVARLQIAAFPYPLMAFPAIQNVSASAPCGLQVAGPAGASVALLFDAMPQSVPLPPYGTIGLAIPPLLTFDGIGLGFPGSVPMALSIGSSGLLYFSFSPVPASLA